MMFFLKKIAKLPLYLIYDIVYLLSFIFPKIKNKWLFGAWFGYRYSDNSKYLFEYVCNNRREIDAIWITRERRIARELRKAGRRAYYLFTMPAIWHLLTAKVFCFSSAKSDIALFAMTSRSLKVNLWHGTPLKKIAYDDVYDKILADSSMIYKLKQIVIPFIRYNYDMVIAPSESVQKIFTSAFRMSKAEIPITGYPRNDAFVVAQKPKSDDKLLILYAPTFRKQLGDNKNVNFLPSADEWAIINSELADLNAVMLVRLHFCNQNSLPNDFAKFKNICLDDNDDVQLSLLNADILITDYSSLYFDYLLLNRPIIFVPFDIEEYKQNSRQLYFDYDKVTPGFKANNWIQVMGEIARIRAGEDKYIDDRIRISEYFNGGGQEEMSSELVFAEVLKRC